MNIEMDRVNLINPEGDIENLIYHLCRYKFVLRQLKKTDAVLEVGCGTGYGLHFLSKAAKELMGVDLDTKSIQLAKKHYQRENVTYAVQNIHTFAKEKQYDVIICFEVIEHMEREEALKLLKRIKVLTKEKGTAYISTPRSVPFEQRSKNRQMVHVHEYTYQEFREDLEKVFANVIIFNQVDEIISSGNPNTAWNYIAICN